MTAAMLIQLALGLLQVVLKSAGVGGLATEITAGIQAAVDELTKVQGTPVTFAQLEQLQVEPKW